MKFTQLQAIGGGDGSDTLYGLDEQGRVWQGWQSLDREKNVWSWKWALVELPTESTPAGAP